jgi:hypothetical protein
MSFNSENITLKRKKEEEKITDEDIIEAFGDDDLEFAALLIESNKYMQQIDNAKPSVVPLVEEKMVSTSEIISETPLWKKELQSKIEKVSSIEDLDCLTKELVKKNRPKKQPKKKLVRVENFYQRHIGGLQWMTNFIERTKTDALSRPYVERMMQLELKFKQMIENDDLLGTQLAKDE